MERRRLTVLARQVAGSPPWTAVMNGPEAQRPAAPATLVDDGIEELRRRVAELTLAVEMRDAFIAVAGYELRNPMTPIIGQLEHLHAAITTGRCPPEQFGPRLERIQQTVRHYVRRGSPHRLLETAR